MKTIGDMITELEEELEAIKQVDIRINKLKLFLEHVPRDKQIEFLKNYMRELGINPDLYFNS